MIDTTQAAHAYKVETLSGEQLHMLEPQADTNYLVINLGHAAEQSPVFNETVRIAIGAAMSAVLASMNIQVAEPQLPLRLEAATEVRVKRNGQRREALNAKIFADSVWLQAKELSTRANFSSSNASAGPNRWKKGGKIFAIQHNGKDYFPEYALDEGYRPLPVVKEIITLFGNRKTAWGLAIWFGSKNSWLGDRMPKDLLTAQPERVLSAAQAEVEGGIHG